MDLLDHLVAENVVAVEHLDGADGARAGVVGVLHLGEAALPDGLADLVRPHPRLPPRRRGLRHPSGGSARTGPADGWTKKRTSKARATRRRGSLGLRLARLVRRAGSSEFCSRDLRSARVRLYRAAALGIACAGEPVRSVP